MAVDPAGVRLKLRPITLLPVNAGVYDIAVDLVGRTGTLTVSATQELFASNKYGVRLCIGAETNELHLGAKWDPAKHLFPGTPGGTGFSSGKPTLLQYAEYQNLWGKKLPCWATLYDWTGTVYPGSKSNVEPMQLPMRWYQGFVTAEGIAASQPAAKFLSWGQGRRLVRLQYRDREPLNQLFFVDAGGRLETSETYRGFDACSYLLALIDVSMNICKIAQLDGASLAAHLSMASAAPLPALGSWEQIRNALPAELGSRWMLWNSGHAFVIAQNPHWVVVEWTNQGLKLTPVDQWQGPGVYQVRRFPPNWAQLTKAGKIGSHAGPWGQSWKQAVA